jgi:hypothetical protein
LGISRFNQARSRSSQIALYSADAAPQDGLVAEFLLNEDTGTTAADAAQGNDGKLIGAVWNLQR